MRQTIALLLLGIAVAVAALRLLPSGPAPDGALATFEDGDPWPRSSSVPAPAAFAPALQPLSGEAQVVPPIAADSTEAEPAEDASVTRVDPARRLELLVEAGFSRVRAEEIVRREAELRLAAASAEFQSTGTVSAFAGAARRASDAGLRKDLGEADFERYLSAMGRPTRVVVAGFTAESAAAYAGLMPGDEILAYGGERVFNLADLNALALQRSAGETVVTTVVREGQALELYVTGGPLGLTPTELP